MIGKLWELDNSGNLQELGVFSDVYILNLEDTASWVFLELTNGNTLIEGADKKQIYAGVEVYTGTDETVETPSFRFNIGVDKSVKQPTYNGGICYFNNTDNWIYSGENYAIDLIVESEPVDVTLTFNYDMSNYLPYLTCYNWFNSEADNLYVTGTFCNWTEPGQEGSLLLLDDDADSIYSGRITVESEQYIEYKFFSGEGWDGGEWDGDPNRIVYVGDEDVSVTHVTDEFFHSWAHVTFNFYTESLSNFNPDEDTIYISGSFNNWAEPGNQPYCQLNKIDMHHFQITKDFLPDQTIEYNYYINSGWDGAEGDTKRKLTFDCEETETHDTAGVYHKNITYLESFSIFPNPFSSHLTIENTSGSELTYELFSYDGRLVWHQKISGPYKLNTGIFDTGLYVLIVKENTHVLSIQKFIKQ